MLHTRAQAKDKLGLTPIIYYTTHIHHSTTQYLGFGLSGSNTATSMFQADATIAWVDDNGMPQARDYYLSDYVQVCFTLHNVSVPLTFLFAFQ